MLDGLDQSFPGSVTCVIANAHKMWVIKVGGSLEAAARLRALLALLADYAHSGLIVVPGGGRFAERVRAEQRVTGMDDATAHRLAIGAMEQYGALLCGMDPRLYPVTDVSEIGGAGEGSTVPVWLPGKLLGDEPGEPGIPANWQVTSDSLALWFAGKINAEALILVKSTPARTNRARELATSGYLDDYFPEMMKKTGLGTITCLGIDEQETLRQALTSGAIPPELRISVHQVHDQLNEENQPSPDAKPNKGI